MNIIEKQTSELKPYRNNPRNNGEAIRFVAASIKEFGFKVPIIIDKDNVIIAGHTRLEAAKRLDLKTVPCILADDLTEEQIKAFRLADNKTAEIATWDLEKLEVELEGIKDLEMADFGFFDFEQASGTENEEELLERQKKEFEERMAAGELSDDDEEYQEFLKKFEAKKTTDDCYTPELVYEAVADYVAKQYNVKRTSFVRPFVPGGDYENYSYPKNCAVVDNPPFSILAEILKFYEEKKIKFFLFAPALTLFSSSSSSVTCLCTGVTVIYENGASVNTSFVTNMEDSEIQFMSAPELYHAVEEANEKTQKEKKKTFPKYQYPIEVVTAPMLTPYSRYGIDFRVNRNECFRIRELDSQKESEKAIYGSGFLISESKKAEREKAERWELSKREKEIIKALG